MPDKHLHRRYKSEERPRKGMRVGVAFDVRMAGWKGIDTGRCLDLSSDGIRLRCAKAFAAGDRLALSFTIPGESKPIDIVGDVKWVEPAGSLEQFLVGCEFVHTDETRARFKKISWDLESGALPEALRDPEGKTVRRTKKS